MEYLCYNRGYPNANAAKVLVTPRRALTNVKVITMATSDSTSNLPLKKCIKCGKEKPATREFFYLHSSAYPKLRSVCIPCFHAKAKAKNFQPVNSGEKVCIDCERTLPATTQYFYAAKRELDGLIRRCKDCYAAKKGTPRRVDPYLEAPEGQKRCIKCKLFLPLDSFCKNKRRSDGLDNRCRKCAHESHKNWYEENKEYVIATGIEWQRNNRDAYRMRMRAWGKKNKDKLNISVHKRLATKRNLPFDFTNKDWGIALNYWGDKCAICGKSPDFWTILAKDHWIPLSDKSLNNPGTVAWNIIPLCHARKDGFSACNVSKSNSDPVEWLIETLGKRKAAKKLVEIQAYFDWVKTQKGSVK